MVHAGRVFFSAWSMGCCCHAREVMQSMIESLYARLPASMRMALRFKKPDLDPDVLKAHGAAMDALYRDKSGMAFLFLGLAVACIQTTRTSLEWGDTLLWTLIFLCFQVFRLMLRSELIPGRSIQSSPLLAAMANAIPFGILAFAAVDEVPQIQYMSLTLMHVFVVVTVIAIYPGFIELHRVYSGIFLLSLACGWFISGYSSGSVAGLVVLGLFGILEMASQQLYRCSVQKIQQEVTHRDVTNRLWDKIEVLEGLNESKTSLLAAACHDLRQPTHAMGLLIEAIVSGKEDVHRREKLRQLQRSNTNSANMLSALMDLSRLDSGGFQAVPAVMGLQDLLDEARAQFVLVAQQKGLNLFIPHAEWKVYSDPYLLRRVVFNLLSNAIKYTREGEVVLSLSCSGTKLLMTIADTGIGIAQSWQSRVFEEYARPNRGVEGLGIGLSTVKKACTLMHHPLTFESRLGRGTTFTLELKLVEQCDVESEETGLSTDVGRTVHRSDPTPRLIAVIEDDHVTRQAAVDLLRQWNFEVVEAAESFTMIELLQATQQKPSVLLVDLHLRHANGLAALCNVRALPGLQTLPAIIVTGDTSATFQKMADAACVVVLHKPVPPRELRKAINKLMA